MRKVMASESQCIMPSLHLLPTPPSHSPYVPSASAPIMGHAHTCTHLLVLRQQGSNCTPNGASATQLWKAKHSIGSPAGVLAPVHDIVNGTRHIDCCDALAQPTTSHFRCRHSPHLHGSMLAESSAAAKTAAKDNSQRQQHSTNKAHMGGVWV
jgi:hypothetical protein